MDGVGEHEAVECGHPRGCGLLFDGRVAQQFGQRDQAQERQEQLVELLHLRMGEDRRALTVDPHGPVVRDQLFNVLRQRGGTVAVGDRLIVGDEHHQLDAVILEPDPAQQSPEQMPEVQLPGRSITRQHPGRESAHPHGRKLKFRHVWSFPVEWTV